MKWHAYLLYVLAISCLAAVTSATDRVANIRDVDADMANPMDQAFLQALYAFSVQNVSNAYAILDKALVDFEPSKNWDLYLPLYRGCFDRITGQEPPVAERNARGIEMLETLRSKRQKSVADLVKLHVLELRPPREYLQAICAHHAGSAWAEWAEWRLLEEDVMDATREAKSVFSIPASIHSAIRQEAVMHALRRHKQRAADAAEGRQDSIMTDWLLSVLYESASHQCYRLRTMFKECEILDPNLHRRMQAAGEVVKSLPEQVQPGTYELRRKLKSAFTRCEIRPDEASVWQFFKIQEAKGVPLPASVPRSEEEFMKRAAGPNTN